MGQHSYRCVYILKFVQPSYIYIFLYIYIYIYREREIRRNENNIIRIPNDAPSGGVLLPIIVGHSNIYGIESASKYRYRNRSAYRYIYIYISKWPSIQIYAYRNESTFTHIYIYIEMPQHSNIYIYIFLEK